MLGATAVVVRMAESDVATSGKIVGIGVTDHPTTDAASQIGHPGGVLVPGWAGPGKKSFAATGRRGHPRRARRPPRNNWYASDPPTWAEKERCGIDLV